ncbi:hypothetical protein [Fluviicola chungangensis]|uniref:Uncharacterized protein n=1 Tax=Fluviicola chungangensis TaxID=2597671 RepID=A0A556N3B6_9FLAO|nr:hypothetical protein [Fluviicola chungangensis]TSJ46575.1 hypothetical protein FO442_05295 [Fluviicola chungangensis]
MKTLLAISLLFLSVNTFSQSKIYTITEQYSAMGNTSIDRIIVTDPSGLTTTYDITHFLKDVAKHDSEFNKILNEVILKGYELMDSAPNAHGDMIDSKSIFTRTWFLKKL